MLVLQCLWRDVKVARRAIARGRSTAITHTARGVLSGLSSLRVRVELAYAAATFADAREDRPGAEEWVRFALAARATLEVAQERRRGPRGRAAGARWARPPGW